MTKEQTFPQTLIFDMDDTLSHCNKYFEEVIDQFADQCVTWLADSNVSTEDVKRKQTEFDVLMVSKHGFAAHHFPKSLVETYLYFCRQSGREETPEQIEWLHRTGFSVFETAVEPYPHTVETLIRLQSYGHQLCLYTGGDVQVQRRKIQTLGLEAFFENRVFISVHKTTEVLEAILHKERYDRSSTWMIGNSIRTDIVPALANGIHAIHIPALSEWHYNIVEIDVEPQGAFFQLPSLREVPKAVHDYAAENAW